jgi:hypothetical protein
MAAPIVLHAGYLQQAQGVAMGHITEPDEPARYSLQHRDFDERENCPCFVFLRDSICPCFLARFNLPWKCLAWLWVDRSVVDWALENIAGEVTVAERRRGLAEQEASTFLEMDSHVSGSSWIGIRGKIST